MLPEYVIHNILKKFGPQIEAYLDAVGFFELEGTFTPTDLIQAGPMKKYVLASKAKNTAIWEFLEGTLLKEMELSSAEFAAAYELSEVWNVSDIADAYFKPRAGALIKGMTSTDKKLLTNFIFSNSGMNERPLARSILKQPNLSSIVDNSGFRARQIVRTERHRMAWGSSLEFAKGAGSKTKEWRAVGDSRTRPEHRALDGMVIPINEDFPGEGAYPGAVSINCRCHLEYGFDATKRRTGVQAGTKTPPPYTGLSDARIEGLYA
jgi:SPP1 gp7 family putative phage head morphogenesis protein